MKTEPPASGPADPPGTASSPARILPLLSYTGNQRVLAGWVQQRERYGIPVSQYGGTLQISDADMCGTSIEFERPKASSTEVIPVDRYS
jgi:hypothetical protein